MSATLSDLFGSLFTASFRGVEFHMPDTRREVGRRVERTWYPGLDTTDHEDLGDYDGGYAVTGLILGSDYIRRAKAMEAAFRQPGPGTLVHPWYGEIQVILAKPATISLTEREIRLARFDALFEPWSEQTPSPIDTLNRVLSQVDALKAQARSLLRQALAPLALPLAAIGVVQGYCEEARSTWSTLLSGGRSASALLQALPITALSDLLSVGTLSIDDDWADAVTDRLDAVPAAIADTAAPEDPPMIGPAAEADTTTTTVEARDAADILLGALDGLATGLSSPAPAPALALAGQALTLVNAVSTASGIDFESQQDALAWRGRVDTALTALAKAAASVAVASTGATATGPGALWRSLTEMRGAWLRDMNDRIGRLPSVERLTVPVACSAWLAAHHIAGADPTRVVAQLEDLVRRNGLRHPAIIKPGTVLEILRQ